MALSKTQRAVLTGVVRKLEKGPGGGWDEPSSAVFARDPETMRQLKIWSDTWIKSVLKQVLANDAGEISANELARGY